MKEHLFFIAILPDEPIQKEVTGFKNELAEHFGASHALKSPPHLTLFPPFKWQSNQLNALLQTLDDFAAEEATFSITLKNFSSFPPRVLFIDVEENEHLQQLQQRLELALQQKLHLKNERDHHGFHPHLTIAHKDLKKELYPKAWAHFADQTYLRTFSADALTLLEHQRGRWDIHTDFNFS